MSRFWTRAAERLRDTMTRIPSLFRPLVADERGGVAIIFTLCAVGLLGFTAMAIDYGRATALRVRLQAAIDGAVLAGASDQTGGDRVAIARNYFNAVLQQDRNLIDEDVHFSVDNVNALVKGSTVAHMPMMLGQRWQASFDVGASSSAGFVVPKVRALDVVLCIDATGSMYNTLSAVQTNALAFKSNLDAALLTYGIPQFDQMRVRVVYYRDFGGMGFFNLYYPGMFSGTALGDNPSLIPSSFFTLPTDTSAYSSFVSAQYASGGGDAPESGLECLNEAMNSSWTQVGSTLPNGKKVDAVYPVISIYTDAGAHQPNFTWSVQNPLYPSAATMPRDYAGLLAKWNSASYMDQLHKTLLFYGNPDNQDDWYFGTQSAWSTVKTWPRFSNPGTLTSANLSFVSTLAAGIASTYTQPTLTN